ncbi:MAG: hypothetical protein AN484_25530 [Aphanizomenon flos-aquae WA102]|uniref:DUF7041 domain-containing protein n=1 Tax=Aphanizomenon flos-aquae WA102 TaxID=1710896 RepID=A0A1B7WHS9_APHFL|nr:MAG: hypothetical protein AN484_25530 [Aphanizomenon flos-aquae WA102]
MPQLAADQLAAGQLAADIAAGQHLAAAIASLKLVPYDNENPAIWFRLIDAQFLAAGIRAEKTRYAQALPSLPISVLRDILDICDQCDVSDEPYTLLKSSLIGQYGKSKWQTYFTLLQFPLAIEGCKPSLLMGKLKQLLPHGVSPDTDMFLAMFLLRLSPNTRETLGAMNLKTAAAMAAAADGLWDARGGDAPLCAAAALRPHRSSTPASGSDGGKKADRRRSPAPFKKYQNPNNGKCLFHNFYGARATKCTKPCNWSEN